MKTSYIFLIGALVVLVVLIVAYRMSKKSAKYLKASGSSYTCKCGGGIERQCLSFPHLGIGQDCTKCCAAHVKYNLR